MGKGRSLSAQKKKKETCFQFMNVIPEYVSLFSKSELILTADNDRYREDVSSFTDINHFQSHVPDHTLSQGN
jgi:hypothetical protein